MVRRLPFGQVNERAWKESERGNEDEREIQIKVMWRRWRVLDVTYI